jgi:hypothetical protein
MPVTYKHGLVPIMRYGRPNVALRVKKQDIIRLNFNPECKSKFQNYKKWVFGLGSVAQCCKNTPERLQKEHSMRSCLLGFVMILFFGISNLRAEEAALNVALTEYGANVKQSISTCRDLNMNCYSAKPVWTSQH